MKSILKNNLLPLLICLICINFTSCKKSSDSSNSSSTTTAEKCPNCGSTSGSHPHETVPSLKVCNTCQVGY